MNILLIAFGTRGDVQPVIAFGKGLRAAGHVVQVMAGANFRDWIISHGLDVATTEIDVQAMMQSELGVRGHRRAIHWMSYARCVNCTLMLDCKWREICCTPPDGLI